MEKNLPYVEKYSPIRVRSEFLIYWCTILFAAIGILSLPFIQIEVGTSAKAVIRPIGEKMPVRAFVAGTIDSIKFHEGSQVSKGQTIFTIKNINSSSKSEAINSELSQKMKLREDLLTLCKSNLSEPKIFTQILTAAYSMQLGDYLYQTNARNTALKKSQYELSVAEKLYKDSVISTNEYFKQRSENARLNSEFESFKLSWKSNWEQQLLTLSSGITDLEKQRKILTEENELYVVRAPATGVLFGVNDKYQGSFIQAGEIFGELSPETDLIAECLITPSDIGLIQTGLKVILQIDAFDHSYFGSVQGKVMSIDNDYTIVQQTPVYKVRCAIDQKTLRLKNGYEVKLRKGLTCQARFIVAKRSAFDLLFDKIDDWLNPSRI